ncbi:MAG TPA: YhjD/YihY/BrkB family envelope integrity protein [Actinomycetota bacterium]|nr:YhjD/YihY/BrkB family envelope integrity protein [Actinomycetota bacterium]
MTEELGPEPSGPAEPSSDAAPAPEEPERVGRIAGARARAERLQHRAEELQHRAERRLEHERANRSWVRQLYAAFEADRNRGGGLLAGGIAYRLFLWGLPAALFVVTLLGTASSASGDAPEDVARKIGLGGAVGNMVGEAVAASHKNRWWLLLLGAVLMVWAGRSAARGFRLVSQIAWRYREGFAPSSTKASLAFSGIVLGCVAIQALVTTFVVDRAVIRLGEWLLLTAGYIVLAIWIMAVLPHGGRSWVVVIPGAVVFIAAIRLLSLATVVYFVPKIGRIDDLYGALGIATVILLWLYVIARVFVGAQFLNATFAGVSEARLGAIGGLGQDLPPAGDDRSA